MNPVVWKYDIPTKDFEEGREFELSIPGGARILHVGVQENEPKLWALLHRPEDSGDRRRFRLVETGEPIPNCHDYEYRGTFLLDTMRGPAETSAEAVGVPQYRPERGGYVGHLFERVVPRL